RTGTLGSVTDRKGRRRGRHHPPGLLREILSSRGHLANVDHIASLEMVVRCKGDSVAVPAPLRNSVGFGDRSDISHTVRAGECRPWIAESTLLRNDDGCGLGKNSRGKGRNKQGRKK